MGLRIQVPTGLMADLSGAGEVELATHLRVLPESWQLFGFVDAAQRDIFRTLLGIPGIGPRLALSLLSHLSWQEICQAVSVQDHGRFQTVPGIGKRTAARIVVELAGKIDSPGLPVAAGAQSSPESEAVAALVALGVSQVEAARLVRQAAAAVGSVEDVGTLIAAALQRR